MINDYVHELPAKERLQTFILDCIGEKEGTEQDQIANLAIALGYKRPTTVNLWLDGKAKIPLKHLTPISEFIGRDLSDLLPLWVAAECPDDKRLYDAACRMLSFWEFLVIIAARDVYYAD